MQGKTIPLDDLECGCKYSFLHKDVECVGTFRGFLAERNLPARVEFHGAVIKLEEGDWCLEFFSPFYYQCKNFVLFVAFAE